MNIKYMKTAIEEALEEREVTALYPPPIIEDEPNYVPSKG